MMRSILILTISLVTLCHANNAIGQCNRMTDSIALTNFFVNTQGDIWLNKTNWLQPTRPISTWFGITTNAQGCVTSIKLSNNRLSGFLNTEIGDFKALESLNLSNNQITGGIPAVITTLTNLKTLNLDQNVLNGNIPSSIGNLTQLQELLLSQNTLSGSIPSSIGNLTQLNILSLSQNNIFGSIPNAIGNLTSLRTFYADNNRLSGSMPKGLYSLTQLSELWLNKNMIIGTIDPDIGKLTKMQKFLINDNRIGGTIPAEIGALTALVSFHASNNRFSGDFPAAITKCKSLLSLQLANNDLTGPLPIDLGALTNLSTMDISSNNLTGEIPNSISAMVNLRRIYLDTNNLVGCFPKGMKKFCTYTESQNVNANGYNFRANKDLFYGGDFAKWCSGDGVPKALIQPVTALCEGSDLKLIGSGGNTYSWSGPASFVSTIKEPQVLSIKAENFGKYFLYIEGDYTCKDTATVDVKTIGSLTTSVNSPLCEGTNIQLKSSGGISYTWSGPNNFTSVDPNPTIPNAMPSSAGTYTVVIKTADCEITRTLEVVFTKLGSVFGATSVCEGDTIKLLTQLGAGQSVEWSGPEGFKSSSPNPIVLNAKSLASGDYQAVIKDQNGCQATSTVKVEVRKPVTLILADLPVLCQNSDSIILPSRVQDIAGVWSGIGTSTDSISTFFNPSGLSGDIALNFKPAAACTSPLDKNITVSALSITGIEESPSNSDSDDNGSIRLELNGTSKNISVSYSSPKLSGALTNQNGTIIINNLPSSLYDIRAVDEAGCEDTLSVLVRYTKAFYFLPNVINAKSLTNNVFYVKGSNILSYDMTVYDRWGGVVFENQNLAVNDEAGAWRPSSDRIVSGVYVYKIVMKTLEGDKIHVASITVL